MMMSPSCRSQRSSNRGSGPSVYVVARDGELSLQPVTLASFTADTALVTSGVQDGDKS